MEIFLSVEVGIGQKTGGFIFFRGCKKKQK